MKTTRRILILTLALGAWAVAAVPRKAPLARYTSLWTDSPFTSKPEVGPPDPVANPLEDYALCGVSPIGEGYRVTLINKKKPEDRITVESNRPNKDDFKILQVTRKAGDPLATVVSMSSKAGNGTVAFDEKLLTIAAPPAAKPQVQGQQIPGQPQPALQPGQMPQRMPRPRVVPPPTPAVPPQAPQIQPQPQVQPQVQSQPQIQGQPSHGMQRPDRHGGR